MPVSRVFLAKVERAADDLQAFALGGTPLGDACAMGLLHMSYDAWDWQFGRDSAVPGRAFDIVEARIKAARAAILEGAKATDGKG